MPFHDDARPGIVCYNVQTAVDAKHHSIVEHEATDIAMTAISCRE
jgi:hypothetical protein